jgi:hypothetical protein
MSTVPTSRSIEPNPRRTVGDHASTTWDDTPNASETRDSRTDASERQLQHFEGLDTKAGVILGFDGVLIALARDTPVVPRLIGVALTALSAVLAVVTFRPRKFPTLDPLALRRYLGADPDRTRLVLYEATTDMIVEASQLLQAKARTLRWSLWALLAAVLAFGAAVLLA